MDRQKRRGQTNSEQSPPIIDSVGEAYRLVVASCQRLEQLGQVNGAWYGHGMGMEKGGVKSDLGYPKWPSGWFWASVVIS